MMKKMANEEQEKLDGHLASTKAEFQKHWDALETAVDAYRNHIDEAEKNAQA